MRTLWGKNRAVGLISTETMKSLITKTGIREQVFPDNSQRYTIAIPEDLAEERATPLVVALHWGWHGNVPPYYGKEMLTGLF